jgi:hypothetical protein
LRETEIIEYITFEDILRLSPNETILLDDLGIVVLPFVVGIKDEELAFS